jgi:GDP-4-dehydro-6-deoxy-D-mannose reductase
VRALVTGASGFIGRHLVAHLRQVGDEVIASDRTGPGGADLADADQARRLVAGARPDVVYHLAGYSDVGGSWGDPEGAFRANATATLCLLLAAREADVGRVLVASSADVYGDVAGGTLPVAEECPLRPLSPYAASKVAAEYLALQAHLGGHLATVRIRLFNQLGPGQSDRFVVPALARQIAEAERSGDVVIEVGNLSPRRDFTDVRDSVKALRLLAERGTPGEVYNICSGTDRSVQEVAESLLALARGPLALKVDPSRVRPVDLPVLVGDVTRLRAATGWEPTVPLARTLADVLQEWRARVDTPAGSSQAWP